MCIRDSDTLQLRASVDLILALGGGWDDSARTNDKRVAASVVP